MKDRMSKFFTNPLFPIIGALLLFCAFGFAAPQKPVLVGSVTVDTITETGEINFILIKRIDATHYEVRTEYVSSNLLNVQHQTVFSTNHDTSIQAGFQ